MRTFKFETSEKAWEGLNSFFVLGDEEIKKDGLVSGNQAIAYDNYIEINKAYISPDFDFNKYFGYHKHKWSKLISNYVNINMLEIVRAEILSKEKNASYNVSFQFSNAHDSGHGCLIAMTFIKRPGYGRPLILVSLRSSEITKRLIFDLLLFQRMGEFVYGEGADMSLALHIPNMFTTTENLTMFHIYKDVKKLLNDRIELTKFQTKILATLENFSTIDPEKITYRVFRRPARQLQGLKDSKPLLTKNLKLYGES